MTKKIKRGILSILSVKSILIVASLAITPLLVRALGSSSYGDYAVVTSVFAVSMTFINAGLFEGTRKFISEYPDDMKRQTQIFGFYFRIAAIFSIFGVFVVLLANTIGVVHFLFGEEYEIYFFIMALFIPGHQFLTLARSALLGLHLEHYSEPLRVLRQLVFGSVGLGLAYMGFGVVGALTGQMLALAIAAFAGLFLVHRRITICFRGQLSLPVPRHTMLSYNFNSIIFLFLSTSLLHTDILLLQPLAGSQATGYYKAALVIVEFLWFIPGAVQSVFLHSTSEMWAKKQYERITQVASQGTRYTLLATLLLAIGLAVLAEPFVTIYFGASFRPTIMPLFLLLPGTLGFALARPIYAIGQSKGDYRPLIVASAGASLVNLIFNILLIPTFGIRGAAIATSIGYGSMFIFHVAGARRLGYRPLADLRIVRVTITASVTYGALLAFDSIIASDLILLLIVPPVGFLLYTGLSVWTNAVSQDELQQLIPDFIPL